MRAMEYRKRLPGLSPPEKATIHFIAHNRHGKSEVSATPTYRRKNRKNAMPVGRWIIHRLE
jgi:hypothetical protein